MVAGARNWHVTRTRPALKKRRMQQTALIVLLALAAAATLFALIRGLVTMARGKDVTGVQSNKWMVYRVAFQGLAVLAVMLLFLATRN